MGYAKTPGNKGSPVYFCDRFLLTLASGEFQSPPEQASVAALDAKDRGGGAPIYHNKLHVTGFGGSTAAMSVPKHSVRVAVTLPVRLTPDDSGGTAFHIAANPPQRLLSSHRAHKSFQPLADSL